MISETPHVQEALRRLPLATLYDRSYRIRRALNLNANQETLPVNEQTTAEQDIPYLQQVLKGVEQEAADALYFDTLLEVPSKFARLNKA